MSLDAWMEEFYPVPASRVTKEEALDHSLTKWEGLLPENLEKHGVRVDEGGDLTDGDLTLSIDAETCALCLIHSSGDGCKGCPLSKARDDHACDRCRDSETMSPWSSWMLTRNPGPMVFWLRAAKEEADANRS